MTRLAYTGVHRHLHNTMPTNISTSALKDDFLIRLTIGTDPTVSFLVPKSQINLWGECSRCNLPKMLEEAENEMRRATAAPKLAKVRSPKHEARWSHSPTLLRALKPKSEKSFCRRTMRSRGLPFFGGLIVQKADCPKQ